MWICESEKFRLRWTCYKKDCVPLVLVGFFSSSVESCAQHRWCDISTHLEIFHEHTTMCHCSQFPWDIQHILWTKWSWFVLKLFAKQSLSPPTIENSRKRQGLKYQQVQSSSRAAWEGNGFERQTSLQAKCNRLLLIFISLTISPL